MQKGFYQDEQDWIAFGKKHGVRVVVRASLARDVGLFRAVGDQASGGASCSAGGVRRELRGVTSCHAHLAAGDLAGYLCGC